MSRLTDIEEYFNDLLPFRNIEDIPTIPGIKNPKDYKRIIIKNLIRCGAIPKNKLEKGKTYYGNCRNTDEATWDGSQFIYNRTKFGTTYVDNINHFEDDDGYDLFVPLFIKNENIS
jgi:hypothetical protein